MVKPLFGPGKEFRCIGRTTNLEEANRLAEQYELQGFETQIIKKMQANLVLYEVWVAKESEIFEGKKEI